MTQHKQALLMGAAASQALSAPGLSLNKPLLVGGKSRMRFKRQVYCHQLLRDTAKEFAGEFHEFMAGQSKKFYADWPVQRAFVDLKWGLFLEQARATLAHMLTTPIDEKQKELIHEALVLDMPLHRNRLANTRAVVK